MGLEGGGGEFELVSKGQKGYGTGVGRGDSEKKPRQVVGTVGFRWSCHGEGAGEDWGMKPAVGWIQLQWSTSARVKSLVFILGAAGGHSVLLSRRVTWAEMHFGRDRLMAELRPLPGPCHSLPSTCIFIYCVSFPFK